MISRTAGFFNKVGRGRISRKLDYPISPDQAELSRVPTEKAWLAVLVEVSSKQMQFGGLPRSGSIKLF